MTTIIHQVIRIYERRLCKNGKKYAHEESEHRTAEKKLCEDRQPSAIENEELRQRIHSGGWCAIIRN